MDVEALGVPTAREALGLLESAYLEEDAMHRMIPSPVRTRARVVVS
jgi:hypothetical protein